MGGSAIHSSVALDVLESLLLANQSGVGVMELDWKALSRSLPSAATPKFSELARQADDGDQHEESANDIQKLLLELSDPDLLSTFVEILKGEVGEILRVAPDKIDANRSIFDMGLDSLMGVELGVAVESRFGVRLPVMAISQSPTISKLAERILQQLKGSESAAPDAPGQALIDQAQQVAAQHGADTSVESLTSLTDDIRTSGASAARRMIR
jgi:acyl carrier protein